MSIQFHREGSKLRVFIDGKDTLLQPKPAQLLKVLYAADDERYLSARSVFQSVWGDEEFKREYVNQAIYSIRRTLERVLHVQEAIANAIVGGEASYRLHADARAALATAGMRRFALKNFPHVKLGEPLCHELTQVVAAAIKDSELELVEIAELAQIHAPDLKNVLEHSSRATLDFQSAERLLSVLLLPGKLAATLGKDTMEFDSGTFSAAHQAQACLMRYLYDCYQGRREEVADELLIAVPRLSQTLMPRTLQQLILFGAYQKRGELLQAGSYIERATNVQHRLQRSSGFRPLRVRVLFVWSVTHEFVRDKVPFECRHEWRTAMLGLAGSGNVEVRGLRSEHLRGEDPREMSMELTVSASDDTRSGIVFAAQPSERDQMTKLEVRGSNAVAFKQNRERFEHYWSIADEVVSPAKGYDFNMGGLSEALLP